MGHNVNDYCEDNDPPYDTNICFIILLMLAQVAIPVCLINKLYLEFGEQLFTSKNWQKEIALF